MIKECYYVKIEYYDIFEPSTYIFVDDLVNAERIFRVLKERLRVNEELYLYHVIKGREKFIKGVKQSEKGAENIL